jgi:Sulfur oxidation protein SoxY
MPSRRQLLRWIGGGAMAGLCTPIVSSIPFRSANIAFLGRGPTPRIAISAPDLADARHPVPVGIRITPLTPGQRVEWVELNFAQGPFPGLARFAPPPGPVAIDCLVRLEKSETLLVIARLSDGTSRRAVRRVAVSALAALASVGDL